MNVSLYYTTIQIHDLYNCKEYTIALISQSMSDLES